MSHKSLKIYIGVVVSVFRFKDRRELFTSLEHIDPDFKDTPEFSDLDSSP